MYQPRKIETRSDWLDEDGLKVYCISHSGKPVRHEPFFKKLVELKNAVGQPWAERAGFVIFHEGATARYLVLVYWGNDNELFPVVSVETSEGWVENPDRYSFCLWDLEVMWQERQLYIEHCYSGKKDVEAYRRARPDIWVTSNGSGTPSAPLH